MKKVFALCENMRSMQLRMVEKAKIHYARECFRAIGNENVVYNVMDSYESLLHLVEQ